MVAPPIPSPARARLGRGERRKAVLAASAADGGASAGLATGRSARAEGSGWPQETPECARCKDRSPLCFHCKGETWQRCSRCSGTGEVHGSRPCRCQVAQSRGSKGRRDGQGAGRGAVTAGATLLDCAKCGGTGSVQWTRSCDRCSGEGQWHCTHCKGRGLFPCGACGRGQGAAPRQAGKVMRDLQEREPERGVTVARCTGTEATQIAKLWRERGGADEVSAVWSVNNPRLTWLYRQRRAELQRLLGRAPEELKGFHGTRPGNVLSIVEQGFDAGRRAGQACGSGEYFAKDPRVSVGYCGGGRYMLVCQLCIGRHSTTEANEDGDHIWVPGFCYVISHPAQVLPLYVVCFGAAVPRDRRGRQFPAEGEAELTRMLARPTLFLGACKDERLIDLTFSQPDMVVEAFPAAWWNGDLAAFAAKVFFDPENRYGTAPLSEDQVGGRVLLVQRGGSKFREVAAAARRARARALLVMQAPGAERLLRMVGEGGMGEEPLPAAMISAEDGERLAKLAEAGRAALATAARRGHCEELPPNRPCAMTAAHTDALWLGFLHAHFSDAQLAADVRRFLERHCPAVREPEVRIVRGKFTQAKVALGQPLSRDEVFALNGKPFAECGTERALTVDDAHGSPGQRCPRSIARFCRGQNLRFVDPCWCRHEPPPTAKASFTLKPLELESAKGDEIRAAFLQGAPFHDGSPVVTRICAVENPALEKQHEFYRQYLAQKNGEPPRQVELYHGTNMNILDTVYTHGLFPPSDMEASDECPVSGGKGLRTSLCTNACQFCTKPHAWDRCHMFGLGIYLADLAQKSHRYVSAATPHAGGLREHKMVICSVLLGDALQLEGHLRQCDSMHCMHSLRALRQGDLPKMVDMVRDFGGKRPLDQRDILFVKGLQSQCRPGFSVFNSEFISFHPYQCLPRYEITYLI